MRLDRLSRNLGYGLPSTIGFMTKPSVEVVGQLDGRPLHGMPAYHMSQARATSERASSIPFRTETRTCRSIAVRTKVEVGGRCVNRLTQLKGLVELAGLR